MKNKYFKRLLATAIAISLAISPLTVYAGISADHNTEGSNNTSGSVSGSGKGGASVYNTGVVFYCLDSKTGELLNRAGSEDDQAILFYYNKPDNVVRSIKAKADEPNITRVGYLPGSIFASEFKDEKYKMPQLFTYSSSSGFKANYTAWDNWFENTLVTDPDTGMQLTISAYIVKKYFPEQWGKVAAAHDNGTEAAISLMAEPVAWHDLFTSGKPDSAKKWCMMTPTGWAAIKKENGLENVYTFTDKFDRGVFSWAMRLEYIQFGWWTIGPAMLKSGLISNRQIIEDGYGVNIYNLSDISTRHTIVTPEPASAEVESPTPTNYSVIKVYERMNQETQEIITEGSYITTNAYSELSINKEDGFEIVSAETVSQMIAEVGGTDSYDTITSGKTIKQTLNISNLPTDVTLSQQEPTLIVRYRATDLEIPPIRVTGTHTVPEQRITQSFRDTLIDSITFTKNIYFK